MNLNVKHKLLDENNRKKSSWSRITERVIWPESLDMIPKAKFIDRNNVSKLKNVLCCKISIGGENASQRLGENICR